MEATPSRPQALNELYSAALKQNTQSPRCPSPFQLYAVLAHITALSLPENLMPGGRPTVHNGVYVIVSDDKNLLH